LNIYKLIPLISRSRKSSDPDDTTVVQFSNPTQSTNLSHSHIIRGEVTKTVFKMDPSGQYQRRPQMNGLSMNFQYTGSPVASQATHRMLSFDGLPRAQADGHFINTWSSYIASNNLIPSPMPVTQNPAEWAAHTQLLTDFDDQSTNDYYGYSTIQSNATDGGFPRNMNYADVPRTWPSPYEPRMAYDDSIPPKTFEPSSYMISPQQQPTQNTLAATSGLVYEPQESSRDFRRLSISCSPKMEDDTVSPAVTGFDKSPGFMMPSRESSDDSGSTSRDMTTADVDDHGADEPYAKLIYRALMSSPNHSMVLQEIYQWFRDNTAKGGSDTKGWMNSIRHNLSMNAVRKAHPSLETCSQVTGLQKDGTESLWRRS
jgi:hypothetical protein